MDIRNEKLAYNLIHHSVKLQKGEKLLIDVIDDGIDLARFLVKEAYKVGGLPFVNVQNATLNREIIKNAQKEQVEYLKDVELMRMKGMDAYIAIRGSLNINEMSDISGEKMSLYSQIMREVIDRRVNHTKWCVLRYPNPAMAQLSNISTEGFCDFYYKVCTLDYEKMEEAMKNLKTRLENTDKVHIKGPGTDITFSIKDMPAIPCAGECNIPDGEVFTAPLKTSINGTITYNAPTIYQGITFENISLTFKDGKIISATANNTPALNKILDTDEGARYVGEFALGVNPYITFPMKDILFDEKICGSIHLTPGASYTECDNGNKSSIHWDMVLIQTKEYGGGEIYFDDDLIRKDGLFVVDDLLCLNPEALM